ncbi:MAG: T9SS type A sorting domain-containing protein [Bacteroidales bacterium]
MKTFTTLITRLAIVIAVVCSMGQQTNAQKFVHITDLHVSTLTDAIGEFDQDGRNFAILRNAIVAQAPAFVIATGDIVNSGLASAAVADAANWTALTGKLWSTGTSPNIQYYMNSAKTIPIYFVPGNHDSRQRLQVPTFQSLLGYDAYIGMPTTVPPTGSFTAGINKGSGETARDYWFTNANMVFISLYSGLDATLDANVCNPEGAGLTTAQIDFVKAACVANAGKIKIVAIHHPAVNPNGNANVGTDFENKTFVGTFETIKDGAINTTFKGSDGKTFTEECAFYNVAMVLQGHLHQNVVLDASGTKRSYSNTAWTQSAGTGVNYIQGAEGLNGAYRVINVTSPTAYTVNAPSLATGLYAAIKSNVSCDYNFTPVVQGVTNYLNAVISGAGSTITQLKLYVDGVLTTTINNPASNSVLPYTLASAKSTTSKLKLEVTNSIGTTTAVYALTKLDGTDSWYGRWQIGEIRAIKDPATGVSYNFELSQIDTWSTPRQISMKIYNSAWIEIAGSPMIVQLGIPKIVDGINRLFILPTLISGYYLNEIMIAPYVYPSVTILRPNAGESMNCAEVQVSTSYSGKDIPWQTVDVSPFVSASYFKTLTFNGTASSTDNFTWIMAAPSGAKTMNVALTDKFSTTSTKSITVTYDPTIPFYVYRGPLGDWWTDVQIYGAWPSGSGWVGIYCILYPSPTDHSFTWGGSGQRSTRVELINMIAHDWFISGIASGGAWVAPIPSGGTGVIVVDKNQYETGTFDASLFGTITYKEVYNAVALLLGKDIQGLYRVWASTSAFTRTKADAILSSTYNFDGGNGPARSIIDIAELNVQDNYFSLKSYPNPFNSAVTIEYTLPETGNVSLEVYNITGQLVNTLISDETKAGTHTVQWNGKDGNGSEVTSGVYYCKIVSGEFTQTERLLFIKK